jgi:hypothetical protein
MRRSLLAALVCACACASTTEKPEAAPVEAKPVVPDSVMEAQPKGEAITVVGVIHQDGQRVCDGRGHEQWIDLHYEVGFTPLVVDDARAREVEPLHKRAAIVFGHVQAPPPANPVPSGGECPLYQMRSDWVVTAEGIRIPRGARAAEGIAVERIVPFEGLAVERAGDTLKFALTNALEVPLADKLTLTLHYEGCFGKPGSTMRSQIREGELAPGDTWRAELPAFVHDPEGQDGRQVFRADSIELRAEGKGVAFDFDAGFHEIGAEGVPCPR